MYAIKTYHQEDSDDGKTSVDPPNFDSEAPRVNRTVNNTFGYRTVFVIWPIALFVYENVTRTGSRLIKDPFPHPQGTLSC